MIHDSPHLDDKCATSTLHQLPWCIGNIRSSGLAPLVVGGLIILVVHEQTDGQYVHIPEKNQDVGQFVTFVEIKMVKALYIMDGLTVLLSRYSLQQSMFAPLSRLGSY